MFTPSRMSLVHILVAEDQVMSLFGTLVRTNCFQIVRKDELPEFRNIVTNFETKWILEEFAHLGERVEKVSKLLEVKSKFVGGEPKINPPEILEKVKQNIAEIETEVFPVIDRIKELEVRIEDLDMLSEKIIPLESEGIELESLRNLKFLWLTYGFTIRENFSQFRAGLAYIPHLLIYREIPFKELVYVYLFVPLSYKEDLERILPTAPFSRDNFLDRISGNLKEITEKSEVELWRIREEKVLLFSKLKNLRSKYESTLLTLKRQILVNSFVIRALENVGRVGRQFLISGWVPYNSINRVKKALTPYDKSVVQALPPISAAEAEKSALLPPTKFEHSGFLKPFDWLITTYGYPSYSELDPSPIVALSFLLMFGVMFADVGHGAILFLLGIFFSRFKGLRNLAITIAGCGGSAVIFGLLFGSFFGKEDIIPAFWFRPFDDIMYFLKLSVIFGVVMVSLGLILNTIQNVRRKNWVEVIFGNHGLAGIALYWAVIVTGIFLMKEGSVSFGIKILIASALVVPVLLIMLGRLLYSRLKKKVPKQGIIESAFGVVELGLSILTNTLSFIRVAAFNISHAALCIAVYAIAKQTEQFMPASGTGLSKILTVVPGHFLVLVLEGLVVLIQCLRLEYYEFFSKFFSGQGVKFEPLRVS